MPNKIKYNTGIDTNALNISDWSVGSSMGMGPTTSTSFKNGLNIPVGGYIVYHGTGINGVVVSNDVELIEVLNKLGASIQKEDIGAALNWAHANSVLVLNHYFENVITQGLVLDIEPKHISCFADNKPVTNVVTNTNLDTGWSKGYQSHIAFNDTPPPTGINSPVVGFNRGQSSGYWYSYGDYAPQIPGEIYYVSVWVKTNDPNFKLNFYTANNSESGRYWGPHIAVPGDSQWHRIEWPAFTNSATSQSDSLSFNFQFSEPIGDDTSRTWLCAPMMHTGTEHVPFTIGTRSQNNMIDLSGMSSDAIVLGNPKQDASGNIVLDGSGDHLQINSHPAFNVDARTIEITFKMNSAYPNFAPLAVYANGSSSTNRMWLGIQNNKFQMHGWGTDDPAGTTTINVDEWYTCVFSYDKASQAMKVYTNGKLETTRTNSQGGITATTGMNWYVGAVPGSWQGVTYSDMTLASFKVYDRILSDEEVAQNYYKSEIVDEQLVLNLDLTHPQSYEKGSTVWKSLINPAHTANIFGNVVYEDLYGGFLSAEGSQTTDYITLPHEAIQQGITSNSNWSLEFWARLDKTAGTTYMFSTATPAGGSNGWIMQLSGGYLFPWDAGSAQWGTGIPYTEGELMHVSICIGGGSVHLYKNGKYVGRYAYYRDIMGAYGWVLNQEQDGTLSGFDASQATDIAVSSIRLYNKTLSQDEVLQNYNATAARFK